ncbi:MAG TPA: hypothetical protein VEH04_11405 [Verrucomicrobiae bacterium]|nr:hypothetical protein [Verrucomicrobiae bacterium]
MQLNHPRFHLGIFGGSGTGKTEYGLRFVANAKSRCVFLFDAEGEFSERMKIPPARTVFELDEAIRKGLVCFDPHIMFPGDLEGAIDYYATLTLAASSRLPGRKFFVVDELGQYVTGSAIPRSLKTLVQTGRRYGVDGVFIAQQPNTIHNTIRVQLSEVVCFQLTDDRALEFPAAFGFDVAAIRKLGPHRFICRNNRSREICG